MSLFAAFLRFAIDGWKDGVLAALAGLGRLGSEGAAPEGGIGAENAGGLGTDLWDDSGSER